MTSAQISHPKVQAAQQAVLAAADSDLADRAVALEEAADALEGALADEGPGDSGSAPA